MKFRILIASALAVAVVLGGCGLVKKEKPTLTILLRMMPAQERFLREEIVPNFEKENSCVVKIANFDNEWDIERLLKLDAGKKKPDIDLVKTPFEQTRVLASKGYMQDLFGVMDSDHVMMDLAEYHALASGLGYFDNKPYYIPRKLETRIMFYRKSMVADAVAKFDGLKKQINDDLKKLNGYGLPKDYALEADPSQWDFYDVYVAGKIWASVDYNGVKMGRIAHRGAHYGGTALDLIDKALQLGATKDDVLKLTSDKALETFLWEAIFVKEGVYNLSMWQDKWKGTDLYNGIKDGKVFLTFVQQIDCFNIHGWPDDPGMPGYLPDANDFGLAGMPLAVSFDLKSDGTPAFVGKKAISTGGWWWGIPKASSHKKLAYQFSRFITNRENQAKECSRFGMIPVRKDVLNNLPEVFAQGWVGDIFKTSVDQIKTNDLTTVPLTPSYTPISQLYVDAWYALCVDGAVVPNAKVDKATLKAALISGFEAKEKEALGAH